MVSGVGSYDIDNDIFTVQYLVKKKIYIYINSSTHTLLFQNARGKKDILFYFILK